MSDISVISAKKPVPVAFGDFTLFCENFSAERSRAFTEQTTSGGGIVFSNTGKKAMRITLKGRIYDENLPTSFIIAADSLICSNESFDIEYRGALFSGCRLLSFSSEDKGEDFIYAAVTLITDVQAVSSAADEEEV